MWAIDNRTAYAAERTWVRDKGGLHHWIVAVKATFDIGPNDRLKLADEQAPPLLGPEYFGEPGKSSLRFDSDLGLKKPSTDVIVNAHAHAPRGVAAETVPVTLTVAGVRKSLLVHGERTYQSNSSVNSLSRPARFVTQAIRYESAYGGTDLSDPDPRRHTIDERNPIGRGALSTAPRRDQPAHVIEYPSGDTSKQGPAGYGPIDSWWTPRATYAGTYDESWTKHQKPFLPIDFDERFTLCSPTDQRPNGYLVGGERIELLNMSESGRMHVELPVLRFQFETHFGKKRQEHRADLATVIVEPEERTLMLIWQSALLVKARDCDYLDQTTIIEER